MKMVIGGAYQGKRDYVMDQYGIGTSEIWDCTPDTVPDPDTKCLNHAENYVLYCMRNRQEADWKAAEDRILIFTDIFCGVVPMDTEQRAWREACGRAMTALAKQADSVERIFCGLVCRLK